MLAPKAEARLNAFGIYTIGQLAAARKDFLQSLFGKAGESCGGQRMAWMTIRYIALLKRVLPNR